MKKTISNRVFLRLSAQAEEADIYGDKVISANLTNQILKYADNIRSKDEEFEYKKEDLIEEIKEKLWDSATRVFDYYDETPDAREVQDIIDFESESLISYFESLIHKKIGPYEPKVVGEEDYEDEFIEDDTEDVVTFVDDSDNEDEDEDEDEDEKDEEE
jgi:hypothetical protein